MRRAFLLNFCMWLGLLLVFITIELPGDAIFWKSLQNAGHGVAMCIASLVGILTLRSNSHNLKSAIIVCLSLLFVSVLIEVIQGFIGRGASSDDVLMDATGIIAGICLGTLIANTQKFRLNLALFFLGMVSLAYIFYSPVFYYIADRSSPTLPTLVTFEHFSSNAKIQASNSKFLIGDNRKIWPSSTKKSLHVEYSPSQWPYVRFSETAADWSNYNNLAFRFFNGEDTDIRLNIRVDYILDELSRAVIAPLIFHTMSSYSNTWAESQILLRSVALHFICLG